eukprot:m.43097 g.43097  ORF g.43097 m.43097 type:complete len:544 (+) comp10540_c0_seq6:1-1632(+)
MLLMMLLMLLLLLLAHIVLLGTITSNMRGCFSFSPLEGRDSFASDFVECPCDISSWCDTFCCCDNDCNLYDVVYLFEENCERGPPAPSLRRCVYNDVMWSVNNNGNSGDNVVEEQEVYGNPSLLCIERENRPQRIAFKPPQIPTTTQEFNTFLDAARHPLYQNTLAPLNETIVQVQQKDQPQPQPLLLPSNTLDGRCLRNVYASIPHNVQNKCTIPLNGVATLETLCVSNSILDLPNGEDWVLLPNSVSPSFTHGGCVSSSTNTTPSCGLVFNSTTRVCHNVVLEVYYQVAGRTVNVNVTHGSVHEGTPFVTQLNAIYFSLLQDFGTSLREERSGNPGYLLGKKVLFSSSTPAERVLAPKTLSSSFNGQCTSPSGEGVSFLASSSSACRVVVDLESVSSCADLRDKVQQTYDSVPSRVGKYGNSDVDVPGDWVDVQGTSPTPSLSDTQTTCYGVLIRRELQLQHALVGFLSSPQQIITGARVEYTTTEVNVPCLGSGCVGETSSLVLEDFVSFFDVSLAPEEVNRQTPDLIQDLPADFFKPFA